MSKKVIVSADPRTKIYHLPDCYHVKKIDYDKQVVMTLNEAREQGYRPCKNCNCLRGRVRDLTRSVESLEGIGRRRGAELFFDTKTDTFYIRTDHGFWKTFWRNGKGLVLDHLNEREFDPRRSTKALTYRNFHHQWDVKPTTSLRELIIYVKKHDDAMKMIEEGRCRELPNRTKREKKYFRQAQKKQQRYQTKRIWDLFDQIEREREASPVLCRA